MRTFNIALAIGFITLLGSVHAHAQEMTLRIHHFMSAKAPLHESFLVPFAENIEKASDGRIKVELFDSMSLGGRPGDLYDQAVDGAVDATKEVAGDAADAVKDAAAKAEDKLKDGGL